MRKNWKKNQVLTCLAGVRELIWPDDGEVSDTGFRHRQVYVERGREWEANSDGSNLWRYAFTGVPTSVRRQTKKKTNTVRRYYQNQDWCACLSAATLQRSETAIICVCSSRTSLTILRRLHRTDLSSCSYREDYLMKRTSLRVHKI